MAEYKVSGSDLTSIASAIRTKGGTSAALSFPTGFVSAIGDIPTGGSSPLVSGTFTGNSTDKGSAITVNIPYTGSGYPIAGIIYPSSGGNTGSIASLAQQYAEIMFSFCKMDMSSSPTYSGDVSENKCVLTSLYKYSNSDPTSSTAQRSLTQQFYIASNATATSTTCLRFKDATTMSVFIANTSYGFKEDIEYTYQIIYSS